MEEQCSDVEGERKSGMSVSGGRRRGWRQESERVDQTALSGAWVPALDGPAPKDLLAPSILLTTEDFFKILCRLPEGTTGSLDGFVAL